MQDLLIVDIFSGISSLCFTNFGEALYMMSSSELQRIALATSKAVTPQGTIDVDQLPMNESEQNDNTDKESIKDDIASATASPTNAPAAAKRAATTFATTSTSSKSIDVEHSGLTNGISEGNSPNKANETISSSIGDITVDSVRDHLNATTTTLCSTTTEETVGK